MLILYSNSGESRRNGPSMLARQLKLRLVADEASGIPKSCSNVVVSIHAIATFQAFNDYLRPRILAATGQSDRSVGRGGGRLSGFLDAFAAANGQPPPDLGEPPVASGSTVVVDTAIIKEPISSPPATAPEPTRRRSGRLSGKVETGGATAGSSKDLQ